MKMLYEADTVQSYKYHSTAPSLHWPSSCAGECKAALWFTNIHLSKLHIRGPLEAKKSHKHPMGRHDTSSRRDSAWRLNYSKKSGYGSIWPMYKTIAHSSQNARQFLLAILSLYSVVFKIGNTELYADTFLSVWAMFFCYKQYHYNNPLNSDKQHSLLPKAGSLFTHLIKSFNAFDAYPIEKFRSMLHAQTSENDSGESLHKKAKALAFSKVKNSNFLSVFANERNYNYKHNTLDHLEKKIELKQCRTGT